MPAVIHNNSNTYYILFIPAFKLKIFKNLSHKLCYYVHQMGICLFYK